MPVMLERWNDDKMDALAAKVGGIEVQLHEFRKETREELRELRLEMREQQKKTTERLDEMQRSVFMGALVLSGSYVAGFAAVIGLIATQI